MPEQLKEGWVSIYSIKPYSVMYSIVDATDLKESVEHRNFYVMLALKVWPFAIRDKSRNPELATGILYVLAGAHFDTLLECKDWAVSQWADRENQNWNEEVKQDLRNNLKAKYLKPTKLVIGGNQ